MEVVGRPKYGTSNFNHFVSGDGKQFFLKLYSSKKIDIVNKIDLLFKYLSTSERDFPELIKPINNRLGSRYSTYKDFLIFLYPMVNGKNIAILNGKQLCEVARALNSFHMLKEIIYDKHLEGYFAHKSVELNEKDILYLNSKFGVNYTGFFSTLKFLTENKLKPASNSLLHGDTDFTNYLFKNDKLIALVDIDECYIGDLKEEVIKSVLSLTLGRNDNNFERNKAELFIKQFRKMDYDSNIVDYYSYRHIYSSLKHFSEKNKLSPSSVNISIIKYFLRLFDIYRKNRKEVYSAFQS